MNILAASLFNQGFKNHIVLFLIILGIQNIYSLGPADPQGDFSKGPLYGKNMYIPFLIHYNFPSLPAKSGKQFDFKYHTSLYYVQDVRVTVDDSLLENERSYDKENVLIDYEGCIGELGVSYNFLKNFQAGLDMRIISFYGGFLDPTIEKFHQAFGFPNAGREYFLQNRVYINMPRDKGDPLFLDRTTVSFGDIDIWGKWTFFENHLVSLAGLGAFKLPTGRLSKLSGSNYPDLGFELLSDIRALWFLSCYAQAGLVLPFNLKSNPMFNGLAGIEIHPWDFLSLVVQMNIKTLPFFDNGSGWSWSRIFKSHSTPQTNLLVGFVMRYKQFAWQLYLEEDAITNQGADLTFNIMFSHSFSLGKH